MNDPRLLSELSRLDPSIPFRASSSHKHHTWARTFHSYPSLYIQPQTLPEIQKLVTLARRCRKRLVVVGSGHSPSDLTCSSSWMVNLDDFNDVVGEDKAKRVLTVQGGIRLRDLNKQANARGWTMPNLGSIDAQSIVGAIATATHGSSTRHGLLSQSVRSLRIVLANGSVVKCSKQQNEDLFKAALVSLGALGIIVEVEFEFIPASNIEWVQELQPLDYIIDLWEKDLWTQAEFTRVWWLPYMKRAIVWRADKTDKPEMAPVSSWYGGNVGYHTYHILLWLSQYLPPILPWVEWFVFGMQYGFKNGAKTTAIESQRTGLLMNCLYSQYVNEWAIPLHKGPEAITRISKWLNGEEGSGIPFSAKNLYVHAPIEVRVSDTSISTAPRPLLDNTVPDGPTLYLNATLYRPYSQDPPCRERYYEAVEWLMKKMGGRPHWAKNFHTVTHEDFVNMYGQDLERWVKIRNEVDPEGMFVGEWHRRNLLGYDDERLPCEEKEFARRQHGKGGKDWFGVQVEDVRRKDAGKWKERIMEDRSWSEKRESSVAPSISSSDESFDVLHGAEAESSVLLTESREDEDGVRHRGSARESAVEGLLGTQVFDKM